MEMTWKEELQAKKAVIAAKLELSRAAGDQQLCLQLYKQAQRIQKSLDRIFDREQENDK